MIILSKLYHHLVEDMVEKLRDDKLKGDVKEFHSIILSERVSVA